MKPVVVNRIGIKRRAVTNLSVRITKIVDTLRNPHHGFRNDLNTPFSRW
jgi:hypothetical protein